MKYLLDTNILIKYLAGDKNVTKKIESIEVDRLLISSITFAEFLVYKDKYDVSIIEGIREYIKILDFTHRESLIFGELRDNQVKKYKRNSRNRIIDLLIVSTAISNNLVFITDNLKDFNRIENLQIENWAL